MLRRFGLVLFVTACIILCGGMHADTTVGDFEALNHDQRVARLTELTRKTLDKIADKNPVAALKIQEYFIFPPPGEKYAAGAMALEKQIIEYNRIDPQGYTIENALAKVLTDYLAKNAPATRPATRTSATKPS